MGMTAHVVYRAIDPDACATLSPAVIGAIRATIGFGGLLMTDDIGMGALTGPLGVRARQALAAGCDVVLHCSGVLGEMAEIAAAVPALAGAALARAETVVATRPEPDPFDPDEVLAMLRALGNGGGGDA
jgi:beta-N-acetylhexosaminidase